MCSIAKGERWTAPTSIGIDELSLTRATGAVVSRAVAGDGAEIVVQAPQQIDQNFPLVAAQAGEQPTLALECGNDHLIMRRASLRGQRDHMGAAVIGVGADRN